MLNRLLRILKFLTSTSIFLALNGSLVAVFSSSLYGIETRLPVLLASFLITFSIYNLNKATDKTEDSVNRPEIVPKGLFFYMIPSILATAGSLGMGILIGGWSVVVLVTPLIVGFVYSVKISRSMPRLKEVVGVKSILVAFSWAFTGSLLPATARPVAFEMVTLIFAYIFIQLFVNTVLFDVVDMKGDMISGVRTIPLVLGLRRTREILTAVNTLLIPWFIYCLSKKIFLNYLPALGFGIIYGYAIIWAFSKESCIRFLLEVFVDGEWMPLVVLMNMLPQ